MFFELAPQDVDWGPAAALWSTRGGVLEAVANNLDITHPVSTHILQQITDRGYSLYCAAGFCALDNTYVTYVLLNPLP